MEAPKAAAAVAHSRSFSEPHIDRRGRGTGTLGEIDDLYRAGGSLRRGRMTYKSLDVPAPPMNTHALAHLRDLTSQGWSIGGGPENCT